MNIKTLARKLRAEIARKHATKEVKAECIILGPNDVIEDYNPHALYIRTSHGFTKCH